MKYFTEEWWASGCEDESVFDKYREHYLTIASKLPASMRILEEEHTLHDAKVQSIDSDFAKKEIEIKLKGWDRSYRHLVAYELRFIGVSEMEFKQELPERFIRHDDLGYWEYELVSDDDIEMRMLFASGAQLTIVFNDFEFSYKAI